MPDSTRPREEGLEAPQRQPLAWQTPEFYDQDALHSESARVFDICASCRRCVNLCNAFPTLFDLIDASATMDIDGVTTDDYKKVVDQCYLCDLCHATKCPYVAPHSWAVDFPQLMLRAKAVHFKQHGASRRDKWLTATDEVGRLAGIPIIAQTMNGITQTPALRKLMEKRLGIAQEAWLPPFDDQTLRKRLETRPVANVNRIEPTSKTRGRVAIFATCYVSQHEPRIVQDLVAILDHNHIPWTLTDSERCCGMPKLELGDLQSVVQAKEFNIPILAHLVDEGWDLLAAVPSCVLLFKQQLPSMFPDDSAVAKVSQAFFDPFEYLSLRHREEKLKLDFTRTLGKVVYHVSCHQRVQFNGVKAREILSLIPDAEIEVVERCSGHNGTYAVKAENYAHAVRIAQPVVDKIKAAMPDHYGSDCPLAGHHLAGILDDGTGPRHPLTLLRMAYGTF